jgi:nitroreductase
VSVAEAEGGGVSVGALVGDGFGDPVGAPSQKRELARLVPGLNGRYSPAGHHGAAAYTAAMSDSKPSDQVMADVVLTALRRTRQIRQFTDEPVSEDDLQAILEVARWSGSSMNRQPWTFIVVRDGGDLRRLAELAPNAKHVGGAAVAIAIAMGGDNAEWDAYDEGRAAERILIAANALGLGAGIGWAVTSARPEIGKFLGLEPPAFVRTMISLGHPTEAARQPKSAPGAARRPLGDLVRDR